MAVLEYAMRAIFGLMALVLTALALALLGYAVYVFAGSFRAEDMAPSILNSIGYVVIALAVFDVSKFIFEEEVVTRSEMRFAGEARRGMTKFISTICIAIFLEGLVLVSVAGKEGMAQVIYPALLLLTGVLIIVGLGVYQRLSAGAESLLGGVKGELDEEKLATNEASSLDRGSETGAGAAKD